MWWVPVPPRMVTTCCGAGFESRALHAGNQRINERGARRMSSKVEITRRSAEKSGLTLAELNQFIQECDQAGLDPRAVVKVTTGWKQQLITVSAAAPKQEVFVAEEGKA